MFTDVARENYTYVFTSPEIPISKKFKKYLSNHFSFINFFYLLAVNEIYLIGK